METHTQTLITAAQVRARFGGISDMSLWRWLNDPSMNFPQPLMIQKRRYWRESDISSWQMDQLVHRATKQTEAA